MDETSDTDDHMEEDNTGLRGSVKEDVAEVIKNLDDKFNLEDYDKEEASWVYVWLFHHST